MPDNPCPTCTLLSLHPKDPLIKRTARVSELLRQNHPPLDVELADFRVVVNKSPKILQDLDEKIAQARETLDYLIHARQQAESHIADAKCLLHPIRRLPNEILSEIFFHSVPTWHTRLSFSSKFSLDPRGAPWTLTAVARRWRDIALSMPQLWTYIRFDFAEYSKYPSRQSVYRTTLFLERSKGYPLFVCISHCNAEPAVVPAFAALEVSIPRWKFLEFSLAALAVFSHGNIFSSLEHLIIYSTQIIPNINFDLFEARRVPSLRVLETRSIVQWRSFQKLSLPWSQLTTCRYFSAFDEDGLDFLQQSTSLTGLDVHLFSACSPSVDTVTRLPNVSRFVIKEFPDTPPRCLEEVFKVLELPSLTELCLFSYSVDRVHYLPHLFVGGCRKLVKLHIISGLGVGRQADNTSNLLRFLSCTPCVQDLCLDGLLSVKFIVGLKRTSLSKRLPHLRILDIGACYRAANLIDDTPVIYDMLQSRYMQLEEIDQPEDTQLGSIVDVTMSSSSSRSRVDRPCSCLERVRVPRWLFFKEDQRWKDICGAITVECGIVMKDAK